MAKHEKRVKETLTAAEAGLNEYGGEPSPRPSPGVPGEGDVRSWAVSLLGNPERVVTAANEAGAVAAYRRELGIIATEHEFRVNASSS
jgi:hypothetical protein